MNFIDHFHLKVNAMGDGGPDGGGGGDYDSEKARAEESNAMRMAGASDEDIRSAGLDPEASGERSTLNLGRAGKVFGASAVLTQNPILSLIAAGLSLAYDAIDAGTATPGEASDVGNVEGSHPEVSSGVESIFNQEQKQKEEEEEETKTAEADLTSTETDAGEQRRKAARRRTGYWSTRKDAGGEADVFTPSLFSI